MDENKLKEAGIDYEEAIVRLRGRTDLYERLLGTFPNDKHYESMIEAIAAKDSESAFQYAHALKGMAGNMSMNSLYKDLIPLVDALRAGRADGIDELLAPVVKDYHLILDVLK